MKSITFIILVIFLATPNLATAEDPLIMAFNQRPPYHYIDNHSPNIPKGLVADIAVKALNASGLKVQYQEMSASRILTVIKEKNPFCSFGWFRTPERLQYAKFTHGLLQDAPFVVVASKENRHRIEKHQTLTNLFSDESLIFGTRAGMSYGDIFDDFINKAKVQVVSPDNTQINMIKMLDRSRFHFMLLVPAEIEEAFRSAGVDQSKYISKNFPESPMGNIRYIMCSQGVPDDIIKKIDETLEKIVDDSLLK